MRLLERGRVVRAVARDAHDLCAGKQQACVRAAGRAFCEPSGSTTEAAAVARKSHLVVFLQPFDQVLLVLRLAAGHDAQRRDLARRHRRSAARMKRRQAAPTTDHVLQLGVQLRQLHL